MMRDSYSSLDSDISDELQIKTLSSPRAAEDSSRRKHSPNCDCYDLGTKDNQKNLSINLCTPNQQLRKTLPPHCPLLIRHSINIFYPKKLLPKSSPISNPTPTSRSAYCLISLTPWNLDRKFVNQWTDSTNNKHPLHLCTRL